MFLVRMLRYRTNARRVFAETLAAEHDRAPLGRYVLVSAPPDR
jgi:hypothetical protein